MAHQSVFCAKILFHRQYLDIVAGIHAIPGRSGRVDILHSKDAILYIHVAERRRIKSRSDSLVNSIEAGTVKYVGFRAERHYYLDSVGGMKTIL